MEKQRKFGPKHLASYILCCSKYKNHYIAICNRLEYKKRYGTYDPAKAGSAFFGIIARVKRDLEIDTTKDELLQIAAILLKG